MTGHMVGTREEWRAERLLLLEREKQLTRLHDEIAAERRRLPWVPIEKDYVFETPTGAKQLAQLFDGRSQLVVYHFMMGPDWTEGCPLCSFWADTFAGGIRHLRHRDVTMIVVSRAPLAAIDAYRRRLGWQFEWVSSAGSDFNVDFGVSATPDQREHGGEYNFRQLERMGEELPGLSCFALTDDGIVYHTYSCYGRGLDGFNGAYQLLDLVPKGRDEDALEWPMAWVRRHDRYEAG